jgi:hypothetical protein
MHALRCFINWTFPKVLVSVAPPLAPGDVAKTLAYEDEYMQCYLIRHSPRHGERCPSNAGSVPQAPPTRTVEAVHQEGCQTQMYASVEAELEGDNMMLYDETSKQYVQLSGNAGPTDGRYAIHVSNGLTGTVLSFCMKSSSHAAALSLSTPVARLKHSFLIVRRP